MNVDVLRRSAWNSTSFLEKDGRGSKMLAVPIMYDRIISSQLRSRVHSCSFRKINVGNSSSCINKKGKCSHISSEFLATSTSLGFLVRHHPLPSKISISRVRRRRWTWASSSDSESLKSDEGKGNAGQLVDSSAPFKVPNGAPRRETNDPSTFGDGCVLPDGCIANFQPPSEQKRLSSDIGTLLRRFWKVAAPYWSSEDKVQARLRLAGVFALTLATTGISVGFNFLGRDFYNALASKDQEQFQRQLTYYLGAFIGGIPVSSHAALVCVVIIFLVKSPDGIKIEQCFWWLSNSLACTVIDFLIGVRDSWQAKCEPNSVQNPDLTCYEFVGAQFYLNFKLLNAFEVKWGPMKEPPPNIFCRELSGSPRSTAN